jgi:hypothetical protein
VSVLYDRGGARAGGCAGNGDGRKKEKGREEEERMLHFYWGMAPRSMAPCMAPKSMAPRLDANDDGVKLGAMPLYLGADDYDAKIKVYF